MSKRITIAVLLVFFVATQANAQYHKHRRRGVLLGGLAGAAIGVAIGDKGNNETAGALIGGAVGAIAGGTIGNQKDQRIEHDLRYHSGHRGHGQPTYPQQGYHRQGYPQYNQPYVYPRHEPALAPIVVRSPPTRVVIDTEPVSQAVSVDDVMTMVRNGVRESIIIKQIELHGFERQLSVAEVIEFHKMGLSEGIITAMQIGSAPVSDSPDMLTAPGQSYSTLGKGTAEDEFGRSILPPPPPQPYAP